MNVRMFVAWSFSDSCFLLVHFETFCLLQIFIMKLWPSMDMKFSSCFAKISWEMALLWNSLHAVAHTFNCRVWVWPNHQMQFQVFECSNKRTNVRIMEHLCQHYYTHHNVDAWLPRATDNTQSQNSLYYSGGCNNTPTNLWVHGCCNNLEGWVTDDCTTLIERHRSSAWSTTH